MNIKKTITTLATLVVLSVGVYGQSSLLISGTRTISESGTYTFFDAYNNSTPTLTVKNGGESPTIITMTGDRQLFNGNGSQTTIVGDTGSKIEIESSSGVVRNIREKKTSLFIDVESDAPISLGSAAAADGYYSHLVIGGDFTINCPDITKKNNLFEIMGNSTLDIGATYNNVYHAGNFTINQAGHGKNYNFIFKAETGAATINVNKSSSLTAAAFFLVGLSDLNVGSTVNVAGTMTATDFSHSNSTYMASMRIGTLNILSGGKVEANTSLSSNVYIRNLSSAGEMILKHSLYIANGNNQALITLKEGSNIKTNGASSQAESIIYLVNREWLNGTTTQIDNNKKDAVNAKIALEANQKLGGFRVASSSMIEIALQGKSFELGSIEDIDGGLNFSIIINDFANGLISFDSDSKIVTDTPNINNIVLAYANIDGVKTLLDLEWQTVGDKSFLYSQALVPEPAEWAAIFGALALAFVAYRRRR